MCIPMCNVHMFKEANPVRHCFLQANPRTLYIQYCTFCSFKSIFIYCTVHVLYCTYCTRKSMYGYTNSTVHCTVHIVQILVEYLSVYIACDAERVYYHNNSITASPPYQEGSATAEGVREQDFISQEKRVNSAAAQ